MSISMDKDAQGRRKLWLNIEQRVQSDTSLFVNKMLIN